MKPAVRDRILSGKVQTELGKSIGKSQQTISGWLNKKVPAEYVIPLSRLLGWQVTPHEIRPDLYPNISDAIPQSEMAKPQVIGGSRG